MGRKKDKTEAAPGTLRVETEKQELKSDKYVVTRDGYRVSENEYDSPSCPEALQEQLYWSSIEQKHSWGAPVVIVKFDNKLHRVW